MNIDKAVYDRIVGGDFEAFQSLIQDVVHAAVEESLRALPGVVKSLTVQAAYIQKLNNEFYSRNKDLVNHKDLVAQAIEHVEGNNPGMAYEKVLAEAANKARSLIQTGRQLENAPTTTAAELDHLAGMFEEKKE